jgi:hypothetical protein
MWFVAAVALGTVSMWPACLVVLKASVAPFALIGITRRSWWLGLAALGFASLPFLAWTIDYPRILLNLQGGGLSYSLAEYPMYAIPTIAWLAGPVARRRPVTRRVVGSLRSTATVQIGRRFPVLRMTDSASGVSAPSE